MSWPADWQARMTGTACRFCDEGRPEESRIGLRFHAGEVTDAYLAKNAMVRGYAVVMWRGRHVIEPHHLSTKEAGQYHGEVLRVGAAIEELYQPLKINYMTLGNRMPHLHTHVTTRYWDDPASGGPLPDGAVSKVPDNQLAQDVAALKRLLD